MRFTVEEARIALLLAASLDPGKYASDATKAVILKAQAWKLQGCGGSIVQSES